MKRIRHCPVKLGLGAVVLLTVVACVETGTPERVEVAEAAEDGDPGEAGVPIRLAGPGEAALLVPVRINGQGPYDFVLDTGATLTCVDAELADSLGLEEPAGRVGFGAGIEGAPGSMRLVEIDSLSVGDARAEGLTGCALDLEQIRTMGIEARGLLGLNFLTSFRVTLDFAADRLTLERP